MNNPINLFQYDIDNFLKKYTRFLSKNIYIDNKTYTTFMQEYNYLFKKIEQEKNSLRNIDDSFKKIIVVKDNIKTRIDNDGIVTMGLYYFLLNENSLDE